MTKSNTQISFSYGSNMLLARIRERVPSAKCLGVAELRDYQLAWRKRSKDGSAKCDIEPFEGAIVYGVLYEISDQEKSELDAAEGLGAGYSKKCVTVHAQGSQREASIYYATKMDPSLRPYSWYKSLVLAGAREHVLPDWYIKIIEDVPSIEDLNKQRHSQNMKLFADPPTR